MTNQQAPAALRLAEELEHDPGINRPSVVAELLRLYAENTALQQGYDAARLEIDSLQARVQELGAMLRENRSKRIVELEAQLEAIGAGGVEPLRRRECLHQIAEPAPAPLSDDVAKDAARWRMAILIGYELMRHPAKRTQAAAVNAYMDATHSGSDLTGAVDAALAAQKGTP